MLETIETTSPAAAGVDAVWSDVAAACRRIPPLWDLNNYVAVNPFLGFAGWPVDEAAQAIGEGLDAAVLPDYAYYRRRWAEGAFGRVELARAAARAGRDATVLEDVLTGRAEGPRRPASPVRTMAERHDRAHGTAWNAAVVAEVARWCAVHHSGGGTYWRLPDDGRGLYASWREAAAVDRSLEIAGLAGWRAWIATLPTTAEAAIPALLGALGVPAGDREAYLYRLLGSLYGWASYLRRGTWQDTEGAPGAVAELLAVRLAADAAVAALAPKARTAPTATAPASTDEPTVEDESVRLIFQTALEDAYAASLLGKLAPPPEAAASAVRPSAQAVFCIDVRSEPLRRHLEAQSALIETRGFAGFFGVSLDWVDHGTHSARCPVLLAPGVRVASGAPAALAPGKAVKPIQGAPAAAFTFVEVLGLAYGLGLAADALVASPRPACAEETDPFGLDPDGQGGGLAPEARVDLACGILKNLGLRGTRLARLILLCGHAGQSANNPHAAGLDCGACGGHGGAINARVAAALLNDPHVRRALPDRGWDVPADTLFVPGVHNTTTDEVTLLDTDRIPAIHAPDLAGLRDALAAAGAATRAERAASLGLDPAPAGLLDRWLRRRARDASEVRPEWALARNAAFIAARRCRTRNADLEGRAFLHEYDAAHDPDDSILTLILSAPMVVASWINLQYLGSTVDNHIFGCGTKTLHNRVGSLGVVVGNGGDLRTGLALQSVHAAEGRWYHEPLRLTVVVEAETARIDGVLDRQPAVRALVDNGWVRLVALDPTGATARVRIPGEGWVPSDAVPALAVASS